MAQSEKSQSSSQGGNMSEELDALKADIRQLREDLAELGGAMYDTASAKANRAKSRVRDEFSERAERLRDRLEDARDSGRRTMSDLEGRLEDRPFLYMCGAFVVGLLFGKMMDRS